MGVSTPFCPWLPTRSAYLRKFLDERPGQSNDGQTMVYAVIQQAVADGLSGLFQTPGFQPGWRGFVQSWFGFGDWRLMVRLAVGIAVAVTLASLIAYHPRTYGRAQSAAELNHPAALLIYAVIGAVVAQIVAVQPAMAFVVFGIGGLLRFRTELGEAADTGEGILVTIVGVSCGLHLFPLAVLATGTGWVLLYKLKAGRAYDFALVDLQSTDVDPVALRVPDALAAVGLTLIRKRVQRQKGKIKILAHGPSEMALDEIERSIRETSPTSEFGFDWDE